MLSLRLLLGLVLCVLVLLVLRTVDHGQSSLQYDPATKDDHGGHRERDQEAHQPGEYVHRAAPEGARGGGRSEELEQAAEGDHSTEYPQGDEGDLGDLRGDRGGQREVEDAGLRGGLRSGTWVPGLLEPTGARLAWLTWLAISALRRLTWCLAVAATLRGLAVGTALRRLAVTTWARLTWLSRLAWAWWLTEASAGRPGPRLTWLAWLSRLAGLTWLARSLAVSTGLRRLTWLTRTPRLTRGLAVSTGLRRLARLTLLARLTRTPRLTRLTRLARGLAVSTGLRRLARLARLTWLTWLTWLTRSLAVRATLRRTTIGRRPARRRCLTARRRAGGRWRRRGSSVCRRRCGLVFLLALTGLRGAIRRLVLAHCSPIHSCSR